MDAPSPDLEARFSIPFRLRGHDGRVDVSYGVNRDPRRWGFDHLALGFDPALTHGFPVCRATIDYGGDGYHAVMGWIQVVTVEDRADRRIWPSVDTYPVFWDVDNPFAAFGMLPTLFDAPGPNPPRANERWTADSMLAICDGIARTRQVSPVCGFRWGYDLAAGVPTPFPPERIGSRAWIDMSRVLRESYPAWEFQAGTTLGDDS